MVLAQRRFRRQLAAHDALAQRLLDALGHAHPILICLNHLKFLSFIGSPKGIP